MWIIFATIGIAGLFVGSFLNVVIHRGPVMWGLADGEPRGDLVAPGSYCPACKAPIRRAHLIPLVSFAALGGKCAACKAPIPIRYPAVELLGAIAAFTAVLVFGLSLAALFASLFFFTLIALGVIDAKTGYLPDALSLPLIALGLAVNAFGMFAALPHAAIGAVAGFVSFFLIGEAFRRLRGVDGLGQGDAKLLAAIGAWAGWPALAPAVFAAAIFALIVVAAMKLAGRAISRETPIPFGPALAMAAAMTMIALGLDLPSYYWR